jgi:hypothetical protein
MLGLFDANGDPIDWNDDYGGSCDRRVGAHLGAGTYYLAVTRDPAFSFRGEHARRMGHTASRSQRRRSVTRRLSRGRLRGAARHLG